MPFAAAPSGFPQVAGVGTPHTDVTQSSSKTVECPSHSAGDRLVLIMSWDGNPAVQSISAVGEDSWVERHNISPGSQCRFVVAEIVSRASSGDTQNVTVDLQDVEMGGAQILRITGSHATQAMAASANAQATSAAPDPASLTPSWGSAKTLWIAACGYDSNPTVTVYPTNYTSNQSNAFADNANGAGIGYATRELEAASENPGAFTLSFSDQWSAVTLAVRPA